MSLSSVEAIYPVPVQDPNAMQDSRVASVFQYAIKVEKAMFETASSRVSRLAIVMLYDRTIMSHDYHMIYMMCNVWC